jgi:hypothetical protein
MNTDIDVQDHTKLRRLSAQDALYSHKHVEVSARAGNRLACIKAMSAVCRIATEVHSSVTKQGQWF